ncbi:lasso peptide biosynthesis B2 protein [Streptomyces sp. A1136]|uniref:lasso peptide biosynthesis B2 protein n=1 Tax=Streptomyces sp. A1136 TaxID=2563102 RepID=UPI001F0DD971|nr:lasso peptide biosynthesis B2 protein [Streptomyces sp. A1136]
MVAARPAHSFWGRSSPHYGSSSNRACSRPLVADPACSAQGGLTPARWACLEQSTAGTLLPDAAGRRAEWRHGIAADPVRLHAWIEDAAGGDRWRSRPKPPCTS